MNARAENLSGRVFGRWTVLFENAKVNKNRMWQCRCDCGNERSVNQQNLKHGTSRSCGCLQKEWVRENLRTNTMTSHPIYHSWSGMKDRCFNKSSDNYENYGARGITVCPDWEIDFWNFWQDMASGWRPGLSLDRVDPNGNYEKSNCRWASQKVQTRNKRDTIKINTPWGRMTLVDAAEKMGLNPDVVRDRYRNNRLDGDILNPKDGRSV